MRQLKHEDIESVFGLIQNTIDVSYYGVYPTEAIEFFKDYHSAEHIISDAATGYTIVAECNGEILGTGTLLGTNIRRVFVRPLHQHRGIGKLIVQELEIKASTEKSATLDLEASLVSRQFWELLGFVAQREEYIPVQNGQKLHYCKMVKTLSDG